MWRLPKLGASSRSSELWQVSRTPHEARIAVPFTVCMSNICRAVVSLSFRVLVCMMSVCNGPGECGVTYYE